MSVIDELKNYIETRLFCPEEYDIFVIIPYNDELRLKIKETLQEFVDDITHLNVNSDKKKIKKILKETLRKFDDFVSDTEDKEFVCHCFVRISKILNVNFNNELNKWIYGRILNLFLKISLLLGRK